MASIQHRAGKFCVRWRDAAGKERRRTCQTRRAAEALKRDIEYEKDRGRDWAPVKPAEARPSLIVIAQAYLDDRSRVLAYNTMKAHRTALGLFLDFMDAEHSLDPQSMSRDTLHGFHAHLTGVRGSAPITANRRTTIIKSFWAWAWDHDVYGDHTPRTRRIDLPKVRTVLEPYAPSWRQMDEVIARADGWLRELLIVLRFTGLRGSQGMRIEWRDLDVDQRILRIRPELGKTQAEKAGRWVPVSPHLLELIAAPTWPRCPTFIVKAPPKRATNYLKLAQAWAGSDIKRVQPRHAFRRGWSAGLAKCGKSIDLISMLMGHKTTLAADTYMGALALMPMLRDVVAAVPPLHTFEGCGQGVAITDASCVDE